MALQHGGPAAVSATLIESLSPADFHIGRAPRRNTSSFRGKSKRPIDSPQPLPHLTVGGVRAVAAAWCVHHTGLSRV